MRWQRGRSCRPSWKGPAGCRPYPMRPARAPAAILPPRGPGDCRLRSVHARRGGRGPGRATGAPRPSAGRRWAARGVRVTAALKRLVVVGNGMAGVACVEQILKHAPQFEITIFGDETHVNYNRILLSSVLAGEKASRRDRAQRARVVPARTTSSCASACGSSDVDPEREDRHRRRRQRHAVRQAAAGHRQHAR